MLSRPDVEILTTDNAARWQEIIEQIGTYDFYHLPSFHQLAEIRGEGEAVMPVFRQNGYSFAFPMLLRDLDLPGVQLAAKTKRDSTSVFGFAGPVSSPNLSDNVRQNFQTELQNFFLKNDIISAFCRLNPLTCNHSVFRGYGKTVDVGVTLSIDLTLPPEVQWANYRSDHRRIASKLISEGYRCEQVGVECLDEVFNIYRETMSRLNAVSAFLYEKSYFEFLLNEMPEVMHLFVCRLGTIMTGFRLFSICGGIVSSYLSGTAGSFLRERSSGILYDAGRRWGHSIGAHVMHLGGGMGAQRDTLYDFKKGFATNEHVYRTWRHVVDQEVYDQICLSCTGSSGSRLSTSYFPAYRDPDLNLRRDSDPNAKTLVSEY